MIFPYSVRINYCQDRDCSGRGTCINGIDTYRCECFNDNPEVVVGGVDCEQGNEDTIIVNNLLWPNVQCCVYMYH